MSADGHEPGMFAAADISAPAPDALSRFRAVRARSVRLAHPLSPEDMTAQSMPDASPVKWHLAHTTWFFETFILLPRTGAQPFDPAYGVLFNSYYEALGARTPRALRGLMTRPGVEAVRAYRAHVDAAMERLLIDDLDGAGAALLALGLAHEEQHQELLLTDVLHLLSLSPLHPAYAARPPRPTARPVRMTWSDHPGGMIEIGAADESFAFDNERPRHHAFLQPHRFANRLVTNAEWLRFMREGGYRRPDLWLSDGWAMVQAEHWEAPFHWRRGGEGDWQGFGLHGLLPLDAYAPVAHLSHYEADAYARWAGARLPTEFEWEAHAVGAQDDVNETLSPVAAVDETLQQMQGALWQWTGSSYLPYPGFAPAPGAVGEYNGKFMSGQMVLRGGSFATARHHSRATYRNFFSASARWQFTGLRLTQDATAPSEPNADLLTDSLAGLSRPQKRLSSKHLYDDEGSRLFEAITELDEYYPTRTERALLAEAARDIAGRIAAAGASSGVLVEFGSGASVKTRLLLDALPALAAYAPIDISPSALSGATSALAGNYPNLAILPVEGDFTRPIHLDAKLNGLPRIGFFPGSTIGNFSPDEAEAFLRGAKQSLGPGALFLIGVDLAKDPAVLTRAYDDSLGVTAQFNLNLLTRLNREADADFDLSKFGHRAVWAPDESRMEMRLESLFDQTVHLSGREIRFVAGETIHTESSYKYQAADFEDLAARAGWRTIRGWRSAEPFSFLLTLLQA